MEKGRKKPCIELAGNQYQIWHKKSGISPKTFLSSLYKQKLCYPSWEGGCHCGECPPSPSHTPKVERLIKGSGRIC